MGSESGFWGKKERTAAKIICKIKQRKKNQEVVHLTSKGRRGSCCIIVKSLKAKKIRD